MKLNKELILWGIAFSFINLSSLTYAQSAQLTIADSVHLALMHSPAVKAAKAEAEKTSWLVKENQATNLPTLDAKYSQSKNYPGSYDLPSNYHSSFLEAKTTLAAAVSMKVLSLKPKSFIPVRSIR